MTFIDDQMSQHVSMQIVWRIVSFAVRPPTVQSRFQNCFELFALCQLSVLVRFGMRGAMRDPRP
jgi:hypothetical protein